MRKVLSPALLVVCVLVPARAVQAESAPDPRALVARAIAAEWGPNRVSPDMGLRVKLLQKVSGGGDSERQIIIASFQGDQRAHVFFQIEPMTRVSWIVDGDKGWAWGIEKGEASPPEGLAAFKRMLYPYRVSSLLPLLRGRDFLFKNLGESTVEERPALGVLVSFRGHPDVSLYFDKDSGVLVKYAYKEKESEACGGRLYEVYYRDYRPVNLNAGDERVLKDAGVAADGPGALELLRRQVRPADSEKIKDLIRRLGDESFAVRRQASADLLEQGPAALSLLRAAAKSDDLEVARRARDCLDTTLAHRNPPVLAAALHVVAGRRPAGAAPVLLAFVAQAPGPELERDATVALAAVALRDGKLDPLVARALEDADPRRRAAAAAALGRDGGAFARQPGHSLYLPGVNLPTKVFLYDNGSPLLEREIVEVQLYNRFEDSLFAPPRTPGQQETAP